MNVLLDPELGAKIRAKLLMLGAIATALVALAQSVANLLDTLPHWPWVGSALYGLHAVIVFLARYTSLGNVEPPEGGAE